MLRVLARVLKEFVPAFPTAFECFWWPSVPMLSMGYDPKHFCHGRGIRRYAAKDQLNGITGKFEALQAPQPSEGCCQSRSEDP
jgi:hypothetical protein